MDEQHIIKREGHEEHYDERKVYASCYAACLNTHMQKEDAEKVCEAVTSAVTQWIHESDEVSSDQIFARVTEEMAKHNPDASFMYKTHRDVS